MEFSEAVSGEHLKDLATLLSGLEENNESNYLSVKKQLENRNIESIEVGKLEFSKDEDIHLDSEGQKKYSKEVYFRSIGLVKEVVEGIHQQKPLPIRKAKRLMQNAVNAVLQVQDNRGVHILACRKTLWSATPARVEGDLPHVRLLL